MPCPTAVFWSLADCCAATSLGVSTIKRMTADGLFPEEVPIGLRRKARLRTEVVAWCEQRVLAERAKTVATEQRKSAGRPLNEGEDLNVCRSD